MQCHECWSLMGLEREAFTQNLQRELPQSRRDSQNRGMPIGQFLRHQWHRYRLALIISTLMIGLNHGTALVQGQMTKQRWLSVVLGFMVPLVINRSQKGETDATAR